MYKVKNFIFKYYKGYVSKLICFNNMVKFRIL